MKLLEYIVYVKGHKNSKGETAPWVIKSHKDNHIISSHTSEKAAKELWDTILEELEYYED